MPSPKRIRSAISTIRPMNARSMVSSLLRGQRPARLTLDIFDQLAVRLGNPQHALALFDDEDERTFGNLLLRGERFNLLKGPVAVLILQLRAGDYAPPCEAN